MLADDVIFAAPPALRQLMEIHEETGGSVVAVMEVPKEEVSRYGIIAGEEVRPGLWQVKGLVEKPSPKEAPSNLAVIGRYILSPKVFEILGETEPGRGGEIQLTDALNALCQEKPLYAYAFQGKRFDVGEKLGYMMAQVEIALLHPEIGPAFKEYLRQLCRTLFTPP